MGCSAGLWGKGQIIPVSVQSYPFSGDLAALDLWKEAVAVSSPELHLGLVLITFA